MRLLLACAIVLGSAMSAQAGEIGVTATYLARIATPPGAIFDAFLVGQPSADKPSEVLAAVRVLDPGNPPYAVTLNAPETATPPTIHARLRHADGTPFFDGAVIADGPTAEVIMRPAEVREPPLIGARWRLMLLDGEAAESLEGERDLPWIEFLPEGRIAGTGGCNRLGAGYTLAADGGIAFAQGLSTMMACEDSVMQREGAIFDVFARATRLDLTGDRLTLLEGDAALAVWVADPV